MVKSAHKIIGALILSALMVSLLAVAYDYCFVSPPLNPRCSLCELQNVLKGTFEKKVEAPSFLPAEYWWAVFVFLSPVGLHVGDESPSVCRLLTSPKTGRSPPTAS